jgi:hypothetical protein
LPLLGTARLLTFSVRALILLLLISMLWISLAERYNQALVAVAQALLPDGLSLKALGSHILIDYSEQAAPVSVDGLTLHYGLILLAVLVLAAVGIGVLPRVGWLLAMGAGAFLLHVIGVAMLARGVAWAAGDASAGRSGALVFSLFAVLWGLLPAVFGGAWCFMYWLPRAAARPPSPRHPAPPTHPRKQCDYDLPPENWSRSNVSPGP